MKIGAAALIRAEGQPTVFPTSALHHQYKCGHSEKGKSCCIIIMKIILSSLKGFGVRPVRSVDCTLGTGGPDEH